jgi:hypothetical protein
LNRSLLRPKIQSLLRIRGNHLLDQIRHSDSTHQVRRIARLVGDIAAITSTLTMTLCDIIFKFCSNHSERQVRARHSLTLEAIINDVCAQPLVLQERGFLEEHCKVTARQLGFSPASPACITVSQTRLLCEKRFKNQSILIHFEPHDVFAPQQGFTTACSRAMPCLSPLRHMVC